ncbi:MAG: hypothetical protein ABSD38_37595, partial [Syntrophorhabdales bacterium]
VTPMLLYLLASLPEARTVCGKAACTGLCGGRWVTGVPTAIRGCGGLAGNRRVYPALAGNRWAYPDAPEAAFL